MAPLSIALFPFSPIAAASRNNPPAIVETEKPLSSFESGGSIFSQPLPHSPKFGWLLCENVTVIEWRVKNRKARSWGVAPGLTLSRCDNLGGVVAQVGDNINIQCECVKSCPYFNRSIFFACTFPPNSNCEKYIPLTRLDPLNCTWWYIPATALSLNSVATSSG